MHGVLFLPGSSSSTVIDTMSMLLIHCSFALPTHVFTLEPVAQMKETAEAYLGEKVIHVVVTAPACAF